MTVTVDMAISLDGYVAGTDVTLDNPGGDGAEPLFEWIHELASWRERQGMTGGVENRDSELMRAWFDATGAVVMGRTMYDTGEKFWGDNPPFRAPVFVLTHRPRPTLVKEGGTTFTFVTDGVHSALERARAAAGDRNVDIAGGASTVRQYLREGLVDELHLHVVPVLLGAGLRLFDDLGAVRRDLEPVGVVATPLATHLKYRFTR
ncbi:dihydrofolate reductase family protein [Streptomyces stelliscabiei]|uniref:Dihydrofolate reductase n=1 Tax=Streptomyces stelliscabiei TaxID=146820 RepID=A0A8I0P2R4_9ACTN|nr:dihydrofolate reductase family protein [Streptomyces stelliscabiei]KND46329.1 deaminase/reductase [Streptomyces stelliscabiei]MBE1595216.1 dihydrofolate reductase [Streptomyces stelliscabiei]MDX2516174.1 dihydrofolate reductase family protein [Streptomyces stelliscabiei]MDX2553145.1 dihydrofolate reductase family protein [Streptomyces stelliscabiei]MDX2612133.1 dihydrofolate reductase family protein [Streptomyces stelliscabiei]